MKILTWFINRVKRWFDDLVHQAIIDGIELYQKRLYGQRIESDEHAKELQKIFLLIALEGWLLIIFVIVAKVVD